MIRKRGSQFARWIDRFAGIPLVYFLSFLRGPKREKPVSPRRIGILISAAIGDTLVFSPILSSIKRILPDSKITLFVGPSNEPCFSLLEGADEVVVIDPHHFIQAAKRIRSSGHFDLWFDVGQWPRLNAVLSFAANADYRVGFETPGQYRHALYDETVRHSNQVHEWENFTRLVRSCLDVEVRLPGIASPFGLAMTGSGLPMTTNVVMLHPYAGGAKPYLKEWPDIKWKKLAEGLIERGFSVVISAGESDHARAQELARLFAYPEHVSVIPRGTSLKELAQRMASSKMVISVNTGAMHLAAASGVKTIGLHGPTSAHRWGPLGENSRAVTSQLSCSPCLNLGFDYGCPKNLCMLEIPVERVFEAVDELLVGVAVSKSTQQRQKENLNVEVMRPVTNIE